MSKNHILKISTVSKQMRESRNFVERHTLQFQSLNDSCNQSKQCIETKSLSCYLQILSRMWFILLWAGSRQHFSLCVPMIVVVKPIVTTLSRYPEEEMQHLPFHEVSEGVSVIFTGYQQLCPGGSLL